MGAMRAHSEYFFARQHKQNFFVADLTAQFSRSHELCVSDAPRKIGAG
jgi:hypothetical protein